mgnify:CR=1 FL=1
MYKFQTIKFLLKLCLLQVRRGGVRCAVELPDCGEAPLQVGEDVVDVLCAHRQADGVGPDPLVLQLLWGQLAVGGGGRVDHQALDVSHVGQKGEDLKAVNEAVRLAAPPWISKVKMEPPPLGK